MFFCFFFTLTLLPFSAVATRRKHGTRAIRDRQSSLALAISKAAIHIRGTAPNSLVRMCGVLKIGIASIHVSAISGSIALGLPGKCCVFGVNSVIEGMMVGWESK